MVLKSGMTVSPFDSVSLHVVNPAEPNDVKWRRVVRVMSLAFVSAHVAWLPYESPCLDGPPHHEVSPLPLRVSRTPIGRHPNAGCDSMRKCGSVSVVLPDFRRLCFTASGDISLRARLALVQPTVRHAGVEVELRQVLIHPALEAILRRHKPRGPGTDSRTGCRRRSTHRPWPLRCPRSRGLPMRG